MPMCGKHLLMREREWEVSQSKNKKLIGGGQSWYWGRMSQINEFMGNPAKLTTPTIFLALLIQIHCSVFEINAVSRKKTSQHLRLFIFPYIANSNQWETQGAWYQTLTCVLCCIDTWLTKGPQCIPLLFISDRFSLWSCLNWLTQFKLFTQPVTVYAWLPLLTPCSGLISLCDIF